MARTESNAFPARTIRNTRVGDLRPGEYVTIAGRLIESSGSLRIRDASGEIAIDSRPGEIHEIVECTGRLRPPTFSVEAFRRLTPSTRALDASTSRRAIRVRANALRETRAYFHDLGFIEVETPCLVPSPGMEPHLRSFSTRSSRGALRFLHTSPEYAMKRLLSTGEERVYQICKTFRDEPFARYHSGEFTMLEWYRAFASYEEIARDVERLVVHLARKLHGATHLAYGKDTIDLSAPWERLTVEQAFRRFSTIQTSPVTDPDGFTAEVHKAHPSSGATFEDAFFQIFLEQVEPRLGRQKPTLLMDYPESMAALSKCRTTAPAAERFEVYVAGVELANAFTELNDPDEQRRRLKVERRERSRTGMPEHPIDEAFLDALETGMPPAGGIALGFDRLLMLLANVPHIEDTLSFPDPDV